MLLRQLLSVMALPFTVLVIIPLWIARREHLIFKPLRGFQDFMWVAGAVGLLAAGAVLLLACVSLFWLRGRGTLAPWDPPRHFVVQGPYRYVRNPMISGVILALVGEACLLRAAPLAKWAALVALINVVYIPAIEEPSLVRRFGEAYRQYRRAVPRFLPRLHPWEPT